jgi:hypothetical protein
MCEVAGPIDDLHNYEPERKQVSMETRKSKRHPATWARSVAVDDASVAREAADLS